MLRREFIRVFYQMGYNKLIQAKKGRGTLRRLKWIGLLTLLVILISNRAFAEENGVRKTPIPTLIYHSISIPAGILLQEK
jgi:hypothetical protein